jgi:hypothetical protein
MKKYSGRKIIEKDAKPQGKRASLLPVFQK